MSRARKKSRPNPLVCRWKAALASAGLLQEDWAAAHGWTASHVSQCISGARESDKVMPLVLAFIAEQERLIALRAAVTAQQPSAA